MRPTKGIVMLQTSKKLLKRWSRKWMRRSKKRKRKLQIQPHSLFPTTSTCSVYRASHYQFHSPKSKVEAHKILEAPKTNRNHSSRRGSVSFKATAVAMVKAGLKGRIPSSTRSTKASCSFQRGSRTLRVSSTLSWRAKSLRGKSQRIWERLSGSRKRARICQATLSTVTYHTYQSRKLKSTVTKGSPSPS